MQDTKPTTYVGTRLFVVGLLMAMAMLLGMCLSGNSGTAYAAVTPTKVSSSALPGSNHNLSMTSSNVTFTTASNFRQKNFSDRKAVQIKYSKWCNGKEKKTISVNDPWQMKFTNAATINGQKVDVIVKCTKISISFPKRSSRSTKDANYLNVAYVTKTKPWIGGQSSVSDSKAYALSGSNTGVRQTSNISVQVVKSGTSTTYNGKFAQVLTDIDQLGEGEAWTANSGFGSYYWYKDTELAVSGTATFKHKTDTTTTGATTEWRKTGVAGVTNGGSFTSTFVGGNCATVLMVNYRSIPGASKTVSKGGVNPGETITYTVSHKFGTFVTDMWSPYSSLTFTDQLDSRLEYKGAKMLKDSTDVTGSAGTLSQSNGKVTYTFNSNLLSNMSSYTGQTYKLQITARVKDDATGTIPNTAVVNNSGVTSQPSVNITVSNLHGSFDLDAKKALENKDLQANQFVFDVKDADGSVVKTARNDGAGNVDFGSFSVHAPGTYDFTISERDDGQGGIAYDSKESKVKVVVTQTSGSDVLNCAVTYDGSSAVPTFTNSYSASGKWAPSATKLLDGADLKDGQFTFEVLDGSGKVVEKGTNDADGLVDFADLDYTDADDGKTYTYTIREVNDKQEDITYDDSTYTVRLTVTDNGDGTLDFDEVYDDGQGNNVEPTFTNYALVYGDQLPVTGGDGWPYAGLGIVLVAVGIAVMYARKRQHD